MILICHAYSRDNHGDGLLVDLAIQLLRKAIPEESDIRVLALDSNSFSDLPAVHQTSFYSDSRVGRILRAVAGLIYVFGGPNLAGNAEVFRSSRLVVGVGGGYLRAGSFREGLKTLIAHGTQVKMAVTSHRPVIYLPQSIGPLRGIIGNRLRNLIADLDKVAVRDDRSKSELAGTSVAFRAPDLAVLEIARSENLDTSNGYKNVYLIARRLSLPRDKEQAYIASLIALRTRLPGIRLILQSSGRGNDDAAFYDSLGWHERYGSIKEAVAAAGKGVVISVRLHGSLESVLLGCPSVHLSYERKGFGAYDDLGLEKYVHNAKAFSPDAVCEQAKELQRDASAYWLAVDRSRQQILRIEQTLIEQIRFAYQKSNGAGG